MSENMIEERYWQKVQKGESCWMWTGTKNERGYGSLRFGKKMKKATHVSIFISTGEWPERGKVVCHRCDNPSCVRVDHLFVGSDLDNNRDRHSKGRTVINKCPPERKARGQNHGLSKLTPRLVKEIRASTASQREIAKIFGVSQPTIRSILLRRTWKHV